MSDNKTSVGIGFFTLLGILFIGLKLGRNMKWIKKISLHIRYQIARLIFIYTGSKKCYNKAMAISKEYRGE